MRPVSPEIAGTPSGSPPSRRWPSSPAPSSPVPARTPATRRRAVSGSRSPTAAGPRHARLSSPWPRCDTRLAAAPRPAERSRTGRMDLCVDRRRPAAGGDRLHPVLQRGACAARGNPRARRHRAVGGDRWLVLRTLPRAVRYRTRRSPGRRSGGAGDAVRPLNRREACRSGAAPRGAGNPARSVEGGVTTDARNHAHAAKSGRWCSGRRSLRDSPRGSVPPAARPRCLAPNRPERNRRERGQSRRHSGGRQAARSSNAGSLRATPPTATCPGSPARRR